MKHTNKRSKRSRKDPKTQAKTQKPAAAGSVLGQFEFVAATKDFAQMMLSARTAQHFINRRFMEQVSLLGGEIHLLPARSVERVLEFAPFADAGMLSPMKSSCQDSANPFIAKVQQQFSRDLALENDYLRQENKILRSKFGARATLTETDRRVLVKYASGQKTRGTIDPGETSLNVDARECLPPKIRHQYSRTEGKPQGRESHTGTGEVCASLPINRTLRFVGNLCRQTPLRSAGSAMPLGDNNTAAGRPTAPI